MSVQTSDEWFGTFWCPCGSGDPEDVLRDYLAVFRESDDGPEFIDLDLAAAFSRKYGESILCLLGYLLDGADLIEQSGSVTSSAWLTPLGSEVKGRVMAGDFYYDSEALKA